MAILSDKKNDLGILILRVSMSILMLSHGFPKLMKLFSGAKIAFPDPIGIGATGSLTLAVFSEFFCSLLILVGFKTRFAAIPLAITMFVAAFVVHGADPFGRKEKALVYLISYIFLFITGSGRFSLDAIFSKK